MATTGATGNTRIDAPRGNGIRARITERKKLSGATRRTR
jgi:hypothetical protein